MQLFERINKKMYPTYAGMRYLEYAENILSMNQRMLDEMKHIAEENSGLLSVGSTPTRTRYIFPELLTAFQKQYPNFMIEVREAPPKELIQLLDEHIIDFAFYTIHERDDRYIYHHLKQEEIVLCASPDKDLRSIAQEKEGFFYPWIDLKQLENECFLLVSDNWRSGRAAKKYMAEARIQPKKIDFSIVETAVAAASCGLGVCFCPDIMIRRGLFNPTPHYFSVGSTPNHTEFVLVHRKDFPLTNPFRKFIRLSQEILA